MPKYIVTRQERWDTLIEVEAPHMGKAAQRARDGEGDILGDAEFVEYINTDSWEVEEESE